MVGCMKYPIKMEYYARIAAKRGLWASRAINIVKKRLLNTHMLFRLHINPTDTEVISKPYENTAIRIHLAYLLLM